ncbi:hypothetical protein NDU88_008800 [Pleurodeles waltl]|uniref:Uncharacterized protein n=1 Tax=Pleurodeles waltl TaxID=8319 RepID=A0AAV7QPQ9_PLEWA|nr:hypothetical protein NDU88_008800 [Pleurodeles waltl]
MAEKALTVGTRQRYRRCMETFEDIAPAVVDTNEDFEALVVRIKHFVVWAKGAKKSRNWVMEHLAVVAHKAKLKGMQDPTKGFLLKEALKGWAKHEEKKQDSRSPIEFDAKGTVSPPPFGVPFTF